MATTTYTETIIRIKRGTAAEATSNDKVLELGELGIETDTGKAKMGDGSTAWTALDYLPWGKSKGTVTEAAGACTLDDKDIIIITTAGTAILAGQTFDITLTSNLITTASAFSGSIANGTNTTGLPVIQSITPGSGSAVIRILNIGGQTLSDDTNGTLKLTISIL